MVCAAEMAAILKIIENCFRQNVPELSLWGSSQNYKNNSHYEYNTK